MEGFRFFDALIVLDETARQKLFKMIARHVNHDAYMFCLAMTSKRFFATVCQWHWGTRPYERKRVSLTYLFERRELNVLRYLHHMNFLECPDQFWYSEFDFTGAPFEEWRLMCDYIQEHFLVAPGDLFFVFLMSNAQRLLDYAIQKKWYTIAHFDQHFENARTLEALDSIASIVPTKGITEISTEFWTQNHFIWWLRNMHREHFTDKVLFLNIDPTSTLERADQVCEFDVLRAVVYLMCSGPPSIRPHCHTLSRRVKLLMSYELCTCNDPSNHDAKLLRPQKRKKT